MKSEPTAYSHFRAAKRSRAGTDQIQDVLDASARLNTEYDEAVELVKVSVERYRSYVGFREAVEDDWAFNPNETSQEILGMVRDIDDIWFGVFRLMSRVARRVCEIGSETNECLDARRIYSEMLAIECMDNGPLPLPIEAYGQEALAEYANDPTSAVS